MEFKKEILIEKCGFCGFTVGENFARDDPSGFFGDQMDMDHVLYIQIKEIRIWIVYFSGLKVHNSQRN